MKRSHDVDVDFMDMTDDRCLWTRATDVTPGIALAIGDHVIVGDDDADPRVAQVVSIDAAGRIQLRILPGTVEANAALLTPGT